MNWLGVILVITALVVGFFFGAFIMAAGEIGRTFGTIKSKTDDDGEMYLYLDMDRHPQMMARYRTVVFKVDIEDQYRQMLRIPRK